MKKTLLFVAAALASLSMVAETASLPLENGKYYRVKHSSGLYLTHKGMAFTIEADDPDNTAQYFKYVDGDGDDLGNFILDNGYALASDGGWDACYLYNTDADMTVFNVTVKDGTSDMLILNKGMKASKGDSKCYLGTDNNTAGSGVYTDKAGNDGKHYWQVEKAPASYKHPDLAVGEDVYPDETLPADDPRATAYPGYKLVFAEEFNSESGQPSKDIWNYETGFKRNEEIQFYWAKATNSWFENGVLVINGRREADGDVRNPAYDPFSGNTDKYLTWTSASIISKGAWDGGYSWNYGIYEVRAKLPAYTGCWPAIWSTGKQYSWPRGGEIDLMEWYGSQIHGNVCWYESGEKWNGKTVHINTLKKSNPNWENEYHVWRMIWDYDHMEMWCDDILVNNINLNTTVNKSNNANDADAEWNGKNPFRDVRHGMWLNLAMGGRSGGSVANCPDDNYYLVDYARVYQKVGSDGKATYHVDPYGEDATIIVPENNPRQGGVDGIDNVMVDRDDATMPVEYFNLQGQRLADPVPGTMVIVRQGNKAQKVIF